MSKSMSKRTHDPFAAQLVWGPWTPQLYAEAMRRDAEHEKRQKRGKTMTPERRASTYREQAREWLIGLVDIPVAAATSALAAEFAAGAAEAIAAERKLRLEAESACAVMREALSSTRDVCAHIIGGTGAVLGDDPNAALASTGREAADVLKAARETLSMIPAVRADSSAYAGEDNLRTALAALDTEREGQTK